MTEHRDEDRRWGALEAWQKNVDRRFDELASLLTRVVDGDKELAVSIEHNMRIATLEENFKMLRDVQVMVQNLTNQVKELQAFSIEIRGFRSWTTRTIVGIILAALVAFVLKGGLTAS